MTPAAQFRAERHRLGLTMKQTATVIGVHWTTVQRWEAGKVRIPRAAQLAIEAIELEAAR